MKPVVIAVVLQALWRLGQSAVKGPSLAAVGLAAAVANALGGPIVTRLRRSTVAGAALDGVNMGALALMAVVTGRLGRAALVDVWTVLLTVVSAVLLLRYRMNPAWLVLGGAVAGLALAR